MAENYEEMLMNQSAANSAFNANESAINRSWQEYMSGTSHQREVADLIAAGINPVLSANSGASWQAVGNASADPSSVAALSNIATTRMNNITNLEISKISAEAAKAAANATAGATMAAAAMNSGAMIYSANANAEAAKYSADQGYNKQKISSPISAFLDLAYEAKNYDYGKYADGYW